MSRRPFLDVFSSALPRPPSGAEPLTPPFGYPGRPAGRPGPQPGPSRARSSWGTCLALRHWEVRAGSGQARAQVGPGPGSGRARGPGRLALPGVSTTGRGGRLRGFPSSGRRAPPALSSPAWVTPLLCLSGVGVSAALTIPRGPHGAGRGRSALPRRRRAARWEPCGAAWLRLRRAPALFFAPSGALAWVEPGPSASPPAGAAGRD
jgi:hypothetical protein